ncbi:MAG: hypothetical protein IT462_10840 [Planctomycetes bacterium]|nr:hypothetical protein [Planctomycetota bacterium]
MGIRAWVVLAILALCASAGSLNAAAIVWDGSGDGVSFSDGSNWVGNAAPGATDEALFDGSVAETAVTIPFTTIQRLTVNSGAFANYNITFTLTGNLILTGVGAYSLDVGVGDAVTFTSANSVAVTDDVRLQGAASSLTMSGSLVLNGGSVPDITIGDGASLVMTNTLAVQTDMTFFADNTSGNTVITFNAIQQFTNCDLEFDIMGTGDIDVTINGDLRATGDNAYFGMYNLLTGDTERYNVTMNGDFDANGNDNFEIETDFAVWTFPGPTNFLLGTGGTFNDSYWGEILVPVGGTLTIPDNAGFTPGTTFWGIFVMEIDGTFDAGNNLLEYYGREDGSDGTMIRVDAAGTFTQDGDVFIYGSGSQLNTIEGVVVLDGDVERIGAGSIAVVALGSTLTLNGNLTVTGGSFGAEEDGATATAVAATINYNGDVRVDVAGGLELGEGIHNFLGDIDLGGTTSAADVVVAPDVDNDFQFEINLTAITGSPTQTVSIDVNSGSLFAVTSVMPESRIVATGNIHLMFLDVSAATGAGIAWDGDTSCSYVFGDDAIGIFTIVTGELDVQMGSIQHDEVTTAASGDRAWYTFTSTGAGEFIINSYTSEGDQDSAVGDALNGAQVSFQDCTATFTNNIQIFDGGNTGRGTYFSMSNATVSCNGFTVGNNSAANNTEGSDIVADNSTLLIRASLTVNPFGQVFMSQCLIDSGDDLAYDITMAATARGASLTETTITCDAAADVTILLGGAALSMVACLFEDYDASGVEIATNSTVNALRDNIFQNGVASGSHMTLSGLANAAKLNCDNNLFDLSTGTATDSFIDITGTNRLNFRTAGDFGLAAVNVDAALAETYDNDGAGANEVTWDDTLDELLLSASASQPISLVTDGVARQTVFNFDLTATGDDITVTQLVVQMLFSGDLVASDIQSVTVFEDADADGRYDSGEELGSGTLDENHSGGSSVQTVPSVVIADGTTVTWSVAVTFTAGAADVTGTIGIYLSATSGITITESATAVVSGLPLQSADVNVTGGVAAIVIITQPTNTNEDAIITPAVVVELRDSLGNVVLSRTVDIDVDILSGGTAGAVLGGTTTVATNPATGRATFADLSIDLPGTAYILQFDGGVTVDSNAFNIIVVVLPPSGGGDDDGGGCASTGSTSSVAMILALLATLSLGAALRLRRE